MVTVHILSGTPTDSTPTDSLDNVISIDEAMENIDCQGKGPFSKFTKYHYELDGREIFQPIIQYFGISTYESLDELILLYKYLCPRINSANPSKIIIGNDVAPEHQLLIYDIIDDSTIVINRGDSPKFVYKTVKAIGRTLVLLLEQLIFCLLFWRKTPESNTVLFHDKNMELLINEFERKSLNYDVFTKSSYLNSLVRGRDLKYQPLHSQMTLGVFLSELRFYFQLIWCVYYSKDFAGGINIFLNQELQVDMPRTTDYVLRSIMSRNVLEIYGFMFATSAFLSQSSCKSLVIGSLSASGKAILQTASNECIDTYHVPHSVITPKHVSVEGTEHFVCGDLDMRYIRELDYEENLSKYYPYGRPYFYELFTRWGDSKLETETSTLLIATQPRPNRFEFANIVLAMALESSLIDDIVIKIHPAEELSEYEHYSKEYETVRVVDDKLFERLSQSELVATINSNVGLEGMIIGTPCISINLWDNSTGEFSYLKYGPVPVLETINAVYDFFDNLCASDIKKLKEKQTKFARENIQLDEDPSELIIDHIVN